MNKTVLELTEEERRSYKPVHLPSKIMEAELDEYWQRAWETAKQAAQLLHSRFGAKRIMLFGSLVNRALFTVWSDIDLAVWDIPASEFYRAAAVVSGLSAEFKIDIIDPKDCKPKIQQLIEQEGVVL